MNKKILKKFLIGTLILFTVVSIVGFAYAGSRNTRSSNKDIERLTNKDMEIIIETEPTSAVTTTTAATTSATVVPTTTNMETTQEVVEVVEATSTALVTTEATTEVITEATTETTTEVTTEVTTIQHTPGISDYERRLLAGLVYLEGRGEPYETQKMIASVILNRSYMYNTSIESGIYEPGQFSPASSIMSITPLQAQYDAVDEVIMNGVILPRYVLYFRAGYFHEWNGHAPYIQSGNMYFSYNLSDKR